MTTDLARKGKRGSREHGNQVALFKWAAARSATLQGLELLFAIPNQTGGDKAAMIRGQRMKREGQKNGVPDIFLPVPHGPFHGMFIELKAGKNKPTPDQLAWFKALVQNGYAVRVCYGWVEAANSILKYLGIMGEV